MAEFTALPSFIKVCGVTSIEDARCVEVAGASAIGLILAASPRRIPFDLARDICGATRGSILRVGVFRDNDAAFVCDAVDATGVDIAQVHGELGVELAGELRRRNVGIIKALSVGTQEFFEFDERVADAILVDGPRPGSGLTHTWDDLLQRDFERPVIAAGGLSPSNVAQVLEITGAWGVDVATGVEMAPGVKDASLVRDFVANAKIHFKQREEECD